VRFVLAMQRVANPLGGAGERPMFQRTIILSREDGEEFLIARQPTSRLKDHSSSARFGMMRQRRGLARCEEEWDHANEMNGRTKKFVKLNLWKRSFISLRMTTRLGCGTRLNALRFYFSN
jgi:hypothetical protein